MQDQLAENNFLALSKKSFAIKFDLENTEYESIENIGAGAYGVVCSAFNRKTHERVAIKKIPKIFDQPTVAMRTYREIRILRHFKHSNIISIREILLPKEDLQTFQDVYIVLDLMESDLHRIIYSPQELTNEHIRWFLYQILRGLKYIHSANVVHRDLKPSNLLVNGNCDLKIGDFGMARGIYCVPDDANIKMTQYVATRWYRAPEIMLQSPAYTTAVDVWSVGCILAEMIMRKPLFPGKDICHQLQMVFNVVGTPTDEYVGTAHSDLIKEFLTKLPKKSPVDFAEHFQSATPKAVRLLRRLLNLDPKQRLTVVQALDDPYLNTHHEPDDEPDCTPPFDFNFEKQLKDICDKKDLQSYVLRSVITKEIVDYHPSHSADANGIIGEALMTNGEAKHNQTEEVQTEIKTKPESTAATNPDVAKKIESKDSDEKFSPKTCSLMIEISSPGGRSVDVEMKSARNDSKLSVNQQQFDSDVRMLSAKLEEQCIISTADDVSIVPCGDSVVPDTQSPVLDAKAKIKAALLNSELRKQRIELGKKVKTASKPRTALQKQKEREEERRRKQEKALERKKKKVPTATLR